MSHVDGDFYLAVKKRIHNTVYTIFYFHIDKGKQDIHARNPIAAFTTELEYKSHSDAP